MLIIGAILFGIFIVTVTSKKKLSFKYSILWLVFSCIILVIAIFPQIVIGVSTLLHIETPSNALFLLAIFLLFIVIFFLSSGYSKATEKITTLVQEHALLEKRVEELEKRYKGEKENDTMD